MSQPNLVFRADPNHSQHLKIHSTPFECEHCNKAFSLKTDLSRHVNARHRVGQPKFRCSFAGCSSSFKRKDNLFQHNRNFHGKNKVRVNTAPVVRPSDVSSAIQAPTAESIVEETKPFQISPTLILQAANSGKLALLEFALSSGVDVNVTGDDGCNALHCAARAGHADLVKKLLDFGFSPIAINKWDRLPLHEAIISQNIETVETFLREHIYPFDAQTLQLALENGGSDMARLFFRYFEIGKGKHSTNVVLHLCTKIGGLQIVVDLLAASPTPVNEIVYRGQTLLHTAAKCGSTEIVKRLLARDDTAINETAKYLNRTPLHLAAQKGHEEVVSILLAREDTAIDAVDEFDEAPLHLAIYNGHFSVAHLLLKDWRHTIACKSLKGRYLSRAFIQAVFRRCTSLATVLLADPYLDVNCACLCRRPGPQGTRKKIGPLHAVVQGDDVTLTKKLLARTEINVNMRTYTDPAPLLIAISGYCGNMEVTKLLLEHEATDPNLPDFDRRTPLHLALTKGETKIAELLLQHPNINLNLQDDDGNTALHCALLSDHVDVAKLLLAHTRLNIIRGEPCRKSWSWLKAKEVPEETVLQIAKRKWQQDIVKILLNREDVRALSAQEALTEQAYRTTEQHNVSQNGQFTNAEASNCLEWASEWNGYVQIEDLDTEEFVPDDYRMGIGGDFSESSSGGFI